MARRYIKRQEELESKPHTEDELYGIELEKEIIAKIGANKTREYQLDNLIDLLDKDGERTKGYSFYTYRGHVCILDDQGMDVDFSAYEIRTQKRIHKEIMAGNYHK
jgi:hypothetical protein